MFAKEDILFRDYCLKNNLVTKDQWDHFVDFASNYGMNQGIAHALVDAKVFTEQQLVQCFGKAFTVPVMKLYAETSSAPKEIIPDSFIREHRVIPMFLFGNELTVAIVDPPYKSLLDEIAKITDKKIIPVVAEISDFEETLKIQQGGFDELKRIAHAIDLEKLDVIRGGEKEVKRLEQMGDFPPLIMLVEEIFLRAVKFGASDIHLEPFENEVRLRFRFDGVLQRIASFPRSIAEGLAAVIKTKAAMDIFEKHVPQDGRITLTIENRSFDLRVSALPTINGEKIVLRILSQGSIEKKIEDLGFAQHNLALLLHLLRQPNGLLLVTGPTGSGKSTTLYAAINHVKSVEKNIVTVENPVEYKVDTVNQVNVDPDRNLTFANTLRAILRQDPDIALVGEIRDTETGTIATEAALTGHLVLSTLHTNDAISAVPRLINMGVPPYWLAPALIGVVAQRLVRKICPHCKEEYKPGDELMYHMGLSGLAERTKFFRGTGCKQCNFQGYRGRIAIHEVFSVTEEIQSLIFENAQTTKIREVAVKNGFRDLRFDGLKKVIAGLTTLEEIQRVTRSTL
ncbi:MAG: type II/IV secretion system protein [Ignavibacteriales bacterium]|nr:type II/IV secretion system protein [Ignavibacteriales bacterium]